MGLTATCRQRLSSLLRLSVNTALILATMLLSTPKAGAETTAEVRLTTDAGDILIELYPQKAPLTVANFLNYVDNFFYDGIIFHRVIEDFVIQAGSYTFDLYKKQPGDPIANESGNGLRNERGTVAMARTDDPDSARVDFFINLKHNRNLNGSSRKPGYTVFGRVVNGMEVVDRIAQVKTHRTGRNKDLPVTPIRISQARRVDP